MLRKTRVIGKCKNCNTTFRKSQTYCMKCGQKCLLEDHSILDLIKNFFQDFLTFDSKLFRSLYPLIFKPGFLSLEFIKGKRVAYIPPIRMYLFINFIFFLIVGIFNNSLDEVVLLNSYENDTQDSLVSNNFNIDLGSSSKSDTLLITQENEILPQTTQSVDFTQKLEDRLNHIFKDRILTESFNNSFSKNLSIYLLISLPFLGLWFYLLFYSKDNYYTSSLIFSVHIASFYFVLLILFVLLQQVIPCVNFTYWSFPILLVYIFLATKKFYKNSFKATFLKLLAIIILQTIFLFVLLILYFLTLVLFF